VRNVEGFMNSMGVEELEVKYLGKNAKGQLQLSRKAVLEEKKFGNKDGNGKKNEAPVPQMSKEEIDVIASAIEGIKNL
jgi:polyribonucleotide nucleotidyltransferase